MFKKIFLSPFFMPLAFVVLWFALMCGIYCNFTDDLLLQIEDGAMIDVWAKCGYLLLIVLLFAWADDFKDKVSSWGVYIFLAMGCFLRESGIQHHLSTTDSTPFKSRFFLNPDNPMYEKVIYGIILLLVFWCIGYLAVKYGKHLFKSFFKLDTITWSVAVLCVAGVVTKIIDRLPANYKHAHHMRLPEDMYVLCQLAEETGEMFLPYIAIAILYQYHFLKRGLG